MVLALSSGLPAMAAQASPKSEDKCLDIAVSVYSAAVPAATALGQLIYGKAGLCANFLVLPLLRSEKLLASGDLDGEVLRTEGGFAGHPEVLRVPSPVAHIVGILAWRTGQPEPRWGNAKITCFLGHDWAKAAAEKLGAHVDEVPSSADLTGMLLSGRTDGIILYDLDLVQLPQDQRAKISGRELRRVDVFTVLAKRHEALVPRLDSAIRDLEADGKLPALVAR